MTQPARPFHFGRSIGAAEPGGWSVADIAIHWIDTCSDLRSLGVARAWELREHRWPANQKDSQ
jgi:hypothetical protein